MYSSHAGEKREDCSSFSASFPGEYRMTLTDDLGTHLLCILGCEGWRQTTGDDVDKNLAVE